MRDRRQLSVLIALLVFTSVGEGQRTGPKDSLAAMGFQASPDTDVNRGTSSATATLESLIRAISGKWLLDVRFEPSADMPKPVTGAGEETWRAGPGDLELVEEEHIPTPGGEGLLLALIWRDNRAKTLRGMECNNQLPFTCDAKGSLSDITVSWDGKTLRVDEIETHEGKKTIWHETWSNMTPTSFTQTGDVTKPDGSTSRFMTIQGTKVN